MSLLVIKCKQCKKNEINYDADTRGGGRRLCEECLDKNKNEYKQRKNRARRAKRIYPTLYVNLTKNYVYMMEGLKK